MAYLGYLTSITFYGAVNEIGSNKIILGNEDARFSLTLALFLSP